MEQESAAKVSGNEWSFSAFLGEFFSSPLNVVLSLICAYLIYRLLKRNSSDDNEEYEVIKIPPPLPKHDMTLEELRNYDGKGEDGRICIGVNGKVYDCSKGRKFYGPDGPYAAFAGRDATRALADFDVSAVKDEWDDNLDLTPSQKASVQEWEMQFSERYELVGRLVKELKDDSDSEKKDSEASDKVGEEQKDQ
ncbi:membrane-associated progesterone receptor component 2-like protein [Dinothrombium tinctorium]|uniref:Membrane-associated progesterone receptor component 2-like protein n=1 Tax=Dinothrombium tinctorium TaxID=1965070 RepID=A0A3S3S0T2_9ACAR|nr:membrane-associated progesterone receptor component 2-like protein [Dinothrombium tinctorium]RWS07601.1 membrane-associated progesterone receptor component 2-like protein [Dinothrombium tinctorium]